MLTDVQTPFLGTLLVPLQEREPARMLANLTSAPKMDRNYPKMTENYIFAEIDRKWPNEDRNYLFAENDRKWCRKRRACEDWLRILTEAERRPSALE